MKHILFKVFGKGLLDALISFLGFVTLFLFSAENGMAAFMWNNFEISKWEVHYYGYPFLCLALVLMGIRYKFRKNIRIPDLLVTILQVVTSFIIGLFVTMAFFLE